MTVDTLRADRLGIYGSGVPTPNLDRLARAGVYFTNVYAQSPLTLPSHSSILTGTYPTFHGVRDNGRYRLSEEMETLAEILKHAGYQTAAFVGAYPVHSRFGLSQGFDHYDESFPPAPLRLALAERRADAVVAAAEDWLAAERQGPFFVWVHLFDPHAPYDPPDPFEDTYEGEIAYVDRSLEGLFSRAGEDVLVVVTADHGEGLGEHGEQTHSLFVYDSTLHIPLILHGHGAATGTVVEGQARSIDILPTILDLVGQKGACTRCQGASLAPGLRGASLPRLPSYAETYFPRLNLGWSELRSLRDEGWKYIAAPQPELYDLESDPGESRNLASTHPAKVQELAIELESVEASTRGEESAFSAPLADPETVAILRSLGYLSSAEPPERESRPDPKQRLAVWEAMRSGMELLARADWDGVIEAFEPVLEEEPDLLLARSYLAAAYFEKARYVDAVEQTVAILNREPGDVEALLLLGKSYLRLGREVDARQVLARAAETDPASPEPWVELAQLDLSRGNRSEAEASLRKAVERDPESAGVLLLQGKLAMLSGDLTQAESYFRSALARTPLEEEARVQLGNVLLTQRRLEEAESLFEEGIRLRPQVAGFHLGLGHRAALAGEMERAIPHLERALALDPESIIVLNSLGVAYLEVGNREKGTALLKRSLAIRPEQSGIKSLLENLP
ncbi:MAG TPA: sulfatase-like hydrolase/transferase [Vicinamibacteria bacterium]|nr:sulfatase-like hydrolase/transferase [Vicinamibacteria bacterium]